LYGKGASEMSDQGKCPECDKYHCGVLIEGLCAWCWYARWEREGAFYVELITRAKTEIVRLNELIAAKDSLLVAYRLGNNNLACAALDRIKAAENKKC